ncbi:unnamed protein product [Calypogeia fissa]
MATAISYCHPSASASIAVRNVEGIRGDKSRDQTRRRNSIRITKPSNPLLGFPSASIRIEGFRVSQPENWRSRPRREVTVWYAPRANSVAEAQSRFDSANGDSSNSALNEDYGKDGEEKNEEGEGNGLEKDFKMARVCDRLIEVFMVEKTSPAEWRKLLAFSEEWPNIRPHFFQRCSTNAKAEEDPKRRGDLLKLARKLKEVDEDMMRHDELLEDIEKNELALEAIVSRRRKDFTSDFFDHLHTKCNANYKDPDRRDDLIELAKKCYTALEEFDALQEDEEAMGEAQLKFDDILNSPSLEAAVNKIDKLAQRQQLDSKLMLLITKAWAAAKESTMMKDEAKDVMFHLYNVAIGNMQRLVPKEVRIIRHLLSFQSPVEQRAALTEAFSPGSELEGTSEDLLYTTPAKLLEWINIVLDSYRTNKQSLLVKEAQKLMKPEVITRVELLKRVVEDQFM